MTDTATNEPTANEAKDNQHHDATSVRFDSSMTLDEAVSYFEAIVSGLKKGTINFKQGENTITLMPPAHLDVEVRARKKRDKEKISFELSWRTPSESDLQITSE